MKLSSLVRLSPLGVTIRVSVLNFTFSISFLQLKGSIFSVSTSCQCCLLFWDWAETWETAVSKRVEKLVRNSSQFQDWTFQVFATFSVNGELGKMRFARKFIPQFSFVYDSFLSTICTASQKIVKKFENSP